MCVLYNVGRRLTHASRATAIAKTIGVAFATASATGIVLAVATASAVATAIATASASAAASALLHVVIASKWKCTHAHAYTSNELCTDERHMKRNLPNTLSLVELT